MRRLRSLLAFAIALPACSDAYNPGADPCDASPCNDLPGVDVTLDAEAPDVAPDAAPAEDVGDAALDLATDARADAAPDVAADVTVDSPPDVTAPDAALDATPDAALDAAVDATVDAALDATVDARPDLVVDTPAEPSAPDVRDAADAADARADVTPPVDAPVAGGCVSGAVGTHVARFRWTGSGPSSRASVSYEANTLPDRARWRVTANSRSIGYTPVFTDTFLGVGGLDLSGTVFIDVELSTAGLGSISNVTLAVFGRSFNTTASGSFAWRTFSGMGAAPSGLVANSAPYQWYRANATAAFVPGDNGVLLRITPGPPSGAIIASRVEICFDAR